MSSRLLIIDDDQKLNDLLQKYLSDFGFQSNAETSPGAGLARIRQTPPDLVILDVMLPGMDGFEVCRQIRKLSQVPIIMLTARGNVTDRVVGLEIGADDYLPKPFEPRELVARIQSILRRTNRSDENETAQFGELFIDYSKQTVTLHDEPILLTTTEFEALALLTKNAGKVLSRDQILDHLRGMECDAFNRSVDITMSRLRQKLKDDPKQPSYIKTVWGSGYIFIGSQSEVNP